MVKRLGLFKIGIGCAAIVGMVQATPLTAIATYSDNNMAWQDIKGASYTYVDGDNDGILETGEAVTFTVTMEKKNWGKHDFDALKVWIDKTPVNAPSTTLYTNNFIWDFDPTNANANGTWYNTITKKWQDYSYRPWTGGDKPFSFTYTFNTAGTYDITASAMCSSDLSAIVGGNPWDKTKWGAWKETVHSGPSVLGRAIQGETEVYELKVYTQKVPEPSSFSLIFLGITGLIGAAFIRRKKK